MFKKALALVTLVLAMAFATAAFAAVPSKDYVAAAREEIPAAAVMYGYKEDIKDGDVEIKFRDNDAFLTYEVKVDMATKKVLEVEIKGSNSADSTTVVKTEADIRNIILEAYPDAQNILIKLDRDGNKAHYEAHFATAKYLVEADLNPVTGAFVERELKYF